MATFQANVQTPTSGVPGGPPDATATPISTHATSLKNIATPDFLDLSKFSPQLNPNGAGVYQLLLSTGADSLAVDQDQDITITGSFRTETGGAFTRLVGSAVKTGAGHSIDEVDGITTNLFKSGVIEVFHVPQTNTQPNLLTYTLNGLQIQQASPHVVRVTGTNTQIRAGTTTEDIQLLNQYTGVYSGGAAYAEQFRGVRLSAFTGILNTDAFVGMRSEFVELLQININAAYGLIIHFVLKVLQILGSAVSVFDIECTALDSKMRVLETKLIGMRARFQQFSARGGFVLLGLWRIFF